MPWVNCESGAEPSAPDRFKASGGQIIREGTRGINAAFCLRTSDFRTFSQIGTKVPGWNPLWPAVLALLSVASIEVKEREEERLFRPEDRTLAGSKPVGVRSPAGVANRSV
jgi:hypothetical protein